MQEDFIQSLKYTGFTARIKRLSDLLLYDARKLYINLNLGIEPNWHLIFLLLKEEETLTVTEIANRLGFSHPGVIKIIKQMKANDFVKSSLDAQDHRKQQIELTAKAKQQLPIFEQKWEIIQMAVQELIDAQMLESLIDIEQKLKEKSLYERCTEKLSR